MKKDLLTHKVRGMGREMAYRQRIMRLVGGVCAVALGVSACSNGSPAVTGSPDDGEDDATTGEAQELFEMDVTVSTYPIIAYSIPYLVGMDQGYFEDEGIKINEILGSEGGGTTVRNVLAGDLPFGEVSTSAVVDAYNAGAPLVAIAGAIQTVAEVGFGGMAESAEIDSIQDVEGLRLGYTSPGSVTHSLLALSLDAADVPLDQVELVSTGGLGEGLTALESGGIDLFVIMEPFYSIDADPYDVVWWSDEYIPRYQQQVIITSNEFIEEHPDIVEGYLRARQRSIEYIHQNVQHAAELWAEAADIDAGAAQSALERILESEYYSVGFNYDGLMAVERSLQLLNEDDDFVVDWPGFVNQDFLPEDAERVEFPQP